MLVFYFCTLPTLSSFHDSLFELIEQKKINATTSLQGGEFYCKSFFRHTQQKNYQPLKKTAIAYALALKLSLQETQDLLATAGYTLNDAIGFDSAIINFIRRGIYDIIKIEIELYDRNFPVFSN